jgi:hypothetical protein
MKDYKQFILERKLYRSQPSVYYNSHGHAAPFSEIRELEVDERENNTREEYDMWQQKYNIEDTDRCIWVTPSKKQALTYLLPSEQHDDIMGMEEWEVKKYIDEEGLDSEITELDSNTGFIIPESDDGDNGFLFVIKKG